MFTSYTNGHYHGVAKKNYFKRALGALSAGALPQKCVACGQESFGGVFCLTCKVLVGETDHFSVERNETLSRMTLRCELEFAAALGIFTKGGPYQSLLHKLKYRGVFTLGFKEGRRFGIKYMQMSTIPKADIIIPIPSHWRRKLKRGYSQAEIFAKGIERETKIPIRTDVLRTRLGIVSQTTKKREERMNRTYDRFLCVNPKGVAKKRVLLVDDVLTTGATAEAAITALNMKAIKKIQLGLLALAMN